MAVAPGFSGGAEIGSNRIGVYVSPIVGVTEDGRQVAVNDEGLLVMANPVQPVGGNDIFDSARQQDEERRMREAQEHYEQTGERLEFSEYDPLVPINGYEPPDVASDGDAYDERNRRRREDFDANTFLENIRNGGPSKDREEALKKRMEAEKREREKKKVVYEALKEESKKKFNNAVSGLEIEEDDEDEE